MSNSTRTALGAQGSQLAEAYRATPKTKSGAMDRRYNLTKNYNSLSSNSSVAGKVGVGMIAIGLGIDLAAGIKGYKDSGEIASQIGSVNSAWNDVVTAINMGGFIADEYMNMSSLSQIANFVFQGSPIANESLQQTAIRIVQEISGNYQPNLSRGFYGGSLDNYSAMEFVVPEINSLKSLNGDNP